MSQRSEVPPATLPVELTEGGIAVEYLDGRDVFYHGIPTKAEGTVSAPADKELHVLVTGEDGTEGAMYYVNDRKTRNDILEDSGVGRVLVDVGGRAQLFPGVEVSREGHVHYVEADLDAVDGRVFVFIEDPTGELSLELVEEVDDSPEENAGSDDGVADGSVDSGADDEQSPDDDRSVDEADETDDDEPGWIDDPAYGD
ncbi:MAG: DUF5796 family protein [Halobacteriales archaeon]